MTAVKAWFRARMLSVARVFARTGVSPNAVTLITLALNFGVAAVIAWGSLPAGGLLVLVVGALDSLDGALARATGRATTFGAFLDSTMDRYSEAALFLGIIYRFHDDTTLVIIAYLALVGSLMVSYARARAEGLGLDCEVGWLARPERVVILGLGLATGLTLYALIVLAFFTHVTALQRILHVRRVTGKGRDEGNGEG
ncbi:MAG: CDP-alcohol phosphatidyltransferase family protein [Chloroflexi bacterium]|nr:CDP-alcohol phosphatidyltransferase family protein [Chloroflexota bacterium]MCL5026589.1 CDP-alcohol phosphatidyltransferase family protein [Chloroflexota bacterium]